MTKARVARRIAMAAAYGGGGLGVLIGGAFGLVRAEAALARRAIGEPTGEPPEADGVYGAHHSGEPLPLLLLGDSSAGGLGVDHPHQTPGAMLAAGLAECADRPVQLTAVAAVGARSSDLSAQIERVVRVRRSTSRWSWSAPTTSPTGSGRRRPCATSTTRCAGCTTWTPRSSSAPAPTSARSSRCPSRCAGSPGASSRQLAAAQTIAVVEAGGRTVSLGDILGPEFAASPKEMFGPDRFHPSVAGYASAAAALLPSVCASLDVWFGGQAEEAPDLGRGEGVRPVSLAAVEAADEAGTEVAAAQVGGRDRGPRGRWALLRRRPGRQQRRRPGHRRGGRSAAVAWLVTGR